MKSKSVELHIRLLPEEKEAIKKAAYEQDMNISEYGRSILVSASDYVFVDLVDEGARKRHRKNKSYFIRLSEQELCFYEKQAETAGISVSEYIRRSANGNKIVVIPGIKDLTKQITKLGVNINQLTMLAHQGKIREVDLFACNDTLKQILKQLIHLGKG